jgi:hypothetical protein
MPWQKPAVSVFICVFLSFAVASSLGFGKWLPKPATHLFYSLGIRQRWRMFANPYPWANDFYHVFADVHLADGRTLHWESPSTSWRWFYQEPGVEHRSEVLKGLGNRQSQRLDEVFARYVARQFVDQGKPVSVDLWLSPGGHDFPIFNADPNAPATYAPGADLPRYLLKGFDPL